MRTHHLGTHSRDPRVIVTTNRRGTRQTAEKAARNAFCQLWAGSYELMHRDVPERILDFKPDPCTPAPKMMDQSILQMLPSLPASRQSESSKSRATKGGMFKGFDHGFRAVNAPAETDIAPRRS